MFKINQTQPSIMSVMSPQRSFAQTPMNWNSSAINTDILDVPMFTGGGAGMSALPKSLYNYQASNPQAQSLLTINPSMGDINVPAMSEGNNWMSNFFGEGKSLGLNFDTAKFGLGALGGIMQLFSANEARKAIKAQTAIAEKNLANNELAYDTNISNRFRTAAGLYGRNVDDAERTALAKYGTGRILNRGSLDPAKA